VHNLRNRPSTDRDIRHGFMCISPPMNAAAGGCARRSRFKDAGGQSVVPLADSMGTGYKGNYENASRKQRLAENCSG
jgi:hypothetical protein